jgi:adenylate kinase family enzyme
VEPLACDDPLPARPQRILVAGTSGAGKTTVARALSDRLQIPRVDIDGLYHGPGWVPRPEFDADVAAFVATDAWVTEWQYSAARPLLLARADLLVWLDLTRPQVLAQLVPRTLRRRLRRVELWNGNVEPPLWTILTERDHILRWAWRTHPKTAARVRTVLASPDPPVVVRLRSRREVNAWLDGPVTASARDDR